MLSMLATALPSVKWAGAATPDVVFHLANGAAPLEQFRTDLSLQTDEFVRSGSTLVVVANGDVVGEHQLRAALRANAGAVLAQSTLASDLSPTLITVAQGFTIIDRKLKLQAAGHVQLTQRESEVTTLLAEGLSNKLIAARLGISDHTAKFHVNGIMQKLGATTRTEAVALALRHGLIAAW